MRNRVRERFWPTELQEARAAAESRPLPAPVAPKPLGWGPAMLNHLHVEAPVERPYSPGRYSVDALVPGGHLAVVPLPDAAETVMAEIRALAPIATAKAEVAAR